MSNSLSAPDFAKQCGIKYPTFAAWIAARKRPEPTPSSDHPAFLFTNKSRRLIKILYFDGTGYWLVAKRLERGTSNWPKDIKGDRRKLVLKPTALAMLTDRIDLRDGLQRPWYELR